MKVLYYDFAGAEIEAGKEKVVVEVGKSMPCVEKSKRVDVKKRYNQNFF